MPKVKHRRLYNEFGSEEYSNDCAETTVRGYRVTRDDFLAYSAVVGSEHLGTTIQEMVEYATPATCLLEKLAYGVGYGIKAMRRERTN
jgi:hypothetical protein